MKVGLLLEGGAMRGLYTAGVIDYFMENNIEFDGIIGVSAGALFGMNLKSKQKGRVLRYNQKYLNDKRYMGIHSLLTTGNIMNENFCFNKIVNELDPVDFDTFKNSKEDFWVVVTNINTGMAEYKKLDDLKNKEQLEYIRASGSMPFVSKPVMVKGEKYLDGGTSDSIPIEKIMEMEYDKIVVVLTRPIEYRKKPANKVMASTFYRKYPNLVKAINDRYLMYNNKVEKIIQLEKENKIFVIRPSRFVKIKRIEKDFNKLKEMYNLGQEDVKNLSKDLIKYLNK